MKEGKFGSCFSFDGINSIVIKDANSLKPKAITVEAWFYPDEKMEGRGVMLLSKGDGGHEGAGYMLCWKRNRFTGWVYDESGTISEPKTDLLIPS